MIGIVFFVVLTSINTLCASSDDRERNRGSSNRAAPLVSFWDAEEAEKEEKRRRKFRLGSPVQKTGNKRRLPMQKTMTTTEDKIRLSKEPLPYNSRKNDELQLQLRQPGFNNR